MLRDIVVAAIGGLIGELCAYVIKKIAEWLIKIRLALWITLTVFSVFFIVGVWLVIVTPLGKSIEEIVFCPIRPNDVTISIVSPQKEGDPVTVDCQPSGGCTFLVSGSSINVKQRDLKGYVLIYPIKPLGGGWWIQENSIIINTDGTWKSVVQIGDKQHPPKDGDLFQIAAIVVQRDLGGWFRRRVQRIEDLPCLVAESDIIGNLTVRIKESL